MTSTEDIHRAVTEADDIEEIHEHQIPLVEVLRSLASHPLQVIARWNWKAALMGALLRASFYFTVYKAARENTRAALAAAGVELGFRFITSGISGSLVQSFRRASPPWLATLIVTVSLPAFSHTVEYTTHYIQDVYFSHVLPASENNGRPYAFGISVLFSACSAMFSLFAMRKGVLLVGAGKETKSLWADFKRIPLIVLEFVVLLPNLIIGYIRTQRFAQAALVLLGFGATVGSILGIFRGKWSWAWTTALASFLVLLVWTVIVAVGSRIINARVAGMAPKPVDSSNAASE